MASPIYFFPGVRPIAVIKAGALDVAFLEKRGVAPAFAGVRNAQFETSCFEIMAKGPGGHSGTLLVALPGGAAPVRLGYYPEQQTWHANPAGSDCWVAIDNEHPPTPADLVKAKHPAGHEVELGDGNTWRVPIVRCPFKREDLGRSQLLRDFVYGEDGHTHSVRQPASDRLWELSGILWDHWNARELVPSVDTDLVVEACLAALALNYRVGRVEQQLLRLINSDNWESVSMAMLDRPLLEEEIARQKKTQEELLQGGS